MPSASALRAKLGPPMALTSRMSGSACKVHFDGRDIPFDHCAQINDLMQIYWSIQTYRVETIVYAQRSKGWIGVGWGYQAMEGANAVVAYKESYTQRAQIADYHLAYKGSDGVLPEGFQDLTHQRASSSDTHISMMFARPLGAIKRGHVPALNESSRVPLIWAYGDSASFMGSLSKHTKRGWTFVDFGASTYTTTGGSNSYSTFGKGMATHANMMAIAWILLVPLAIVAKRSRARPTLGYMLHRALNAAAMALTAMGFFAAIVNGSHTYTAHMSLGWACVLLLVLQPMGLLWRGAKEDLWRFAHKSVGRLTLLVGIVNVYVGMYIYSVAIIWFVLASLTFAAMIAAAVAFAFGLDSRFVGDDEKTGLIDTTATASASAIAVVEADNTPASPVDNVSDDDDDEVVVLANTPAGSNERATSAPPRTDFDIDDNSTTDSDDQTAF